MKLSLCMIVKDEEEVLERCLESAAPLVDEIVIADTGSADGTRQIAQNYTRHVLSFDWNDDFAAARNFAFAAGTGDYLMWLDADDVIPKESATLFPALRRMLESEQPDMVMCPYDVGTGSGGIPAFTYLRERLLRREAHFLWQGRVHECIAPRGKTVKSDFRVLHLGSNKERGMRNLRIFQKWAREERLGGRELCYYGKELNAHGLYLEAAAVLREALRRDGWYGNKIEACKALSAAYAALGERDKAYFALLGSFRYGEPRAKVCCMLGRLFREDKRWKEAIAWYEGALLCRDHTAEGDLEEPACRSLVPYLELVCCFYALGDMEQAKFFHKKTEELAPEHPSVLYNRKFFGEADD